MILKHVTVTPCHRLSGFGIIPVAKPISVMFSEDTTDEEIMKLFPKEMFDVSLSVRIKFNDDQT